MKSIELFIERLLLASRWTLVVFYLGLAAALCVYALAFFMHESLFGTTGEARRTLSLGNERCLPDRRCLDRQLGGYAQMNSWEDGFEQWYLLIRTLYVGQWHLVTVDQIIPVYAPQADHNDVAGYIQAVKRAVDVWRSGAVMA